MRPALLLPLLLLLFSCSTVPDSKVEVIAMSPEDADTCCHGECPRITEAALRHVAQERFELQRLRQFVEDLERALDTVDTKDSI